MRWNNTTLKPTEVINYITYDQPFRRSIYMRYKGINNMIYFRYVSTRFVYYICVSDIWQDLPYSTDVYDIWRVSGIGGLPCVNKSLL